MEDVRSNKNVPKNPMWVEGLAVYLLKPWRITSVTVEGVTVKVWNSPFGVFCLPHEPRNWPIDTIQIALSRPIGLPM